MGTDIHIYAEKFDGTSWHKLDVKVPDDRDYRTFALMADVRNGFGFAGCVTGVPVTPISAPRGFPHDTAIIPNEGEEWDSPEYCWLGDHTASWLLLSELREVDLKQLVTIIGMITPQQAEKLDNLGILPDSWCGATTEPSAIRRSWRVYLKDTAHLLVAILDKFKDEREPEKVRFVFGFDS